MCEPVSSPVLLAILQAKEERAAAITMMAQTYAATVIVMTVNAPGPRKSRPWSIECLTWGQNTFGQTLRETFPDNRLQAEWQGITPAGPEYRCVVDLPAIIVKETAIAVEESSPRGRLLDIDVYDAAGRSVTRAELEKPSRRCLVCNRPAHECARSRRHTPAELDARINEIIATHRG